jgi:hypothetical protein
MVARRKRSSDIEKPIRMDSNQARQEGDRDRAQHSFPMLYWSPNRNSKMRCIKVFLSSILLISATQAFGADDVVTRAMKSYEKRHYDEAARTLRAEGASIEQGKKGTADLVLGMIYFKNAVLHRGFYQTAVVTSEDYLKRLSTTQGQDRSSFADLYFGEALVESGKAGAAAIPLKKFSSNGSVEARYRAIAKVSLGLGYYRSNQSPKATELWRGADTSDPEVKAELAAAYSKAGLMDKNPSVVAEGILSETKKSGKPLSMRMVKNLVAIYARDPGSIEKAWTCSRARI